MSAPMIQELTQAHDKAVVGGKAVNLAALIQADFPVPGGFVVTTHAYRAHHAGAPLSADATLGHEVIEAWKALGAVPVAVRSSATAEDLAEASMAGQYETFLNVATEQELLAAIAACWASLDSPRTRSYLAEHGVEMSQVAMAVVVQKLIPADVAGVIFTANPQTGSRGQMLIEASWGLGEAVVSGRVQPDVLVVDAESGRVIQSKIADKRTLILAGGRHEGVPAKAGKAPRHEGAEGGAGSAPDTRHSALSTQHSVEAPVEEARRRIACLSEADVRKLWELGRRSAAHFGRPQDMEFAFHAGELFLLQSRPITTLAAAEVYEELLASTKAKLLDKLKQGRGPWVRHNIAETLRHPTPLTWSVIHRFMSGSGGFGAMYRMAGFEPSQAIAHLGFLERIAGEAFMDVSLAPEMFFPKYPFRYDLGELRSSPAAAQAPPTVPAGSLLARMRAARAAGEVERRLRAIAVDFDRKLSQRIIPEFVEWCAAERQRNLQAMSGDELVECWRQRERKVMDQFAPQSLLPSLISGMALAKLRQFLHEHLWDEDVDVLASLFCSAHAPDRTVMANAHLYEVAQGKRSPEQWLAEHGHRAPEEFDLATPRWRERPAKLSAMALRLRGGASPLELHHQHMRKTEQKLEEIRLRLPAGASAELDDHIALARRYFIFREDGKYYLMLGYTLLRDLALEAARRLNLGDDVFHLSLEELFAALEKNRDGSYFAVPRELIDQRLAQYSAEARIALPQVIDAGAVETIGAPPPVECENAHAALAVSPGVAAGLARIVHSPQDAPDLGHGYILVSPSTDPGWTPLFVNAAGLVLECGGTLSHGAVIAREMNIPAVVLPGATSLFADGEQVCVDGRNGSVTRGGIDYAAPKEAASLPRSTRLAPEVTPPPPGMPERKAARMRNIAALAWGIFLLAALLLPERWLYEPSMRLLDAILWPVVRGLGKPLAVAAIAAGLGALTMLMQRLMTDNARLVEAKRRAAVLSRQRKDLPKDSPRAAAIDRAIAPVQGRVLAASLAPLALILGPLVMIFLWFPVRVDPAAWNALAGSGVTIVAMVDAESEKAVALSPGGPLRLKDSAVAVQKLPRIRQTLEKMASLLNDESTALVLTASLPQEQNPRPREEYLALLRDYLRAGVPPQALSWSIETDPRVAGRFPVQVSAEGEMPITFHIVLGDEHPPETTELAGGGAVQSVKVVYPVARRVFWQPLAWLANTADADRLSRWKLDRIVGWDAGWLWTYLLAYLPAMFGMRWLLGVA